MLRRAARFRRLLLMDTAYHEAGHAVMAWAWGMRGVRATIFHDRTGQTVYTTPGRPDPFALAIVALAGHEAEVRFRGRSVRKLPWGDYRDCERLGLREPSIRAVGWVCRKNVWHLRKPIRVVAGLLAAGPRGRFLRMSSILGRANP